MAKDVPMRVLGKSGIRVSEIGIGCWAIGGADWNLGLEMGWAEVDSEEAVRGLEAAMDLGANHFDTADVYGHGRSERLIGQALTNVDRRQVIIGTKVGYFSGTAPNAYHPLHLRHQLEMSLSNLRTEYVDIYYLHNFNFGANDVYLDDAIDTLNRLKEEGKIRAKGLRGPHRYAPERLTHGEAPSDKVTKFQAVAEKVEPDVVQVRYNMLTPSPRVADWDIFRWAEQRKIGVVVNKPLAQGLLLDKYDPFSPPQFAPGDHRRRKAWFTPEALAILRGRLKPIKMRFGGAPLDLARVALQFCLARSQQCCVLAGFRSVDQVGVNMSAAGRLLTPDDVSFIREALDGINEEMGHYFREEASSPSGVTGGDGR
jgi:aryl-alcohol dehydrogenase-like predicted oxidoreductase